jgi:hypothetical protein
MHFQSDDVIYVLRTGGYRTVVWYLHKFGVGDPHFSVGSRLPTGGTTAVRDLERLKGTRRLWFVAAEAYTPGAVDWDKLEMQASLKELDLLGTRLYEYRSGINHAFLYDLKSSNDK